MNQWQLGLTSAKQELAVANAVICEKVDINPGNQRHVARTGRGRLRRVAGIGSGHKIREKGPNWTKKKNH